MPEDIRIKTSFRGHRKRKKLTRLLGTESTPFLIDLWIAAAQNRPRGILEGWDEQDIADEAGWKDDPAVFVSALVECGWLEHSENGAYALHDWRDHQGYVYFAESRKKQAQYAAAARWGKKKKKSKTQVVECKECHAEHQAKVLQLDNEGICKYCRES